MLDSKWLLMCMGSLDYVNDLAHQCPALVRLHAFDVLFSPFAHLSYNPTDQHSHCHSLSKQASLPEQAQIPIFRRKLRALLNANQESARNDDSLPGLKAAPPTRPSTEIPVHLPPQLTTSKAQQTLLKDTIRLLAENTSSFAQPGRKMMKC